MSEENNNSSEGEQQQGIDDQISDVQKARGGLQPPIVDRSEQRIHDDIKREAQELDEEYLTWKAREKKANASLNTPESPEGEESDLEDRSAIEGTDHSMYQRLKAFLRRVEAKNTESQADELLRKTQSPHPHSDKTVK